MQFDAEGIRGIDAPQNSDRNNRSSIPADHEDQNRRIPGTGLFVISRRAALHQRWDRYTQLPVRMERRSRALLHNRPHTGDGPAGGLRH